MMKMKKFFGWLKRSDVMFPAIFVGCAIVFSVVVITCSKLDQNKAKAAKQKWEDEIQSVCGKDMVFFADRVGALSKPPCWKVTCYTISENAYKEHIKCFEQ